MNTEQRFNFDGCGVNVVGGYGDRLATLTPKGQELKVGPMFASAPEMLEALEELADYVSLKLTGFRRDYSDDHCIVQTAIRMEQTARAAISKAKGGQ